MKSILVFLFVGFVLVGADHRMQWGCAHRITESDWIMEIETSDASQDP